MIDDLFSGRKWQPKSWELFRHLSLKIIANQLIQISSFSFEVGGVVRECSTERQELLVRFPRHDKSFLWYHCISCGTMVHTDKPEVYSFYFHSKRNNSRQKVILPSFYAGRCASTPEFSLHIRDKVKISQGIEASCSNALIHFRNNSSILPVQATVLCRVHTLLDFLPYFANFVNNFLALCFIV